MVRRAVAGVAILIILILIVLGIHSCQVSARNRSLKDYNHNVTSLVQQSDATGAKFFGLLSNPNASGGAGALTTQLNETRVSADSELARARGLDVPDEVKGAQQNFLLTMTMRRDGIANIAQLIQRALGSATAQDAIKQIAAEMGRFYSSDVLYKDYVTIGIAAALHAAGITVGPSGEQIEAGQFLPDLGWLQPDFIASKLGQQTTPTTPSGPVAPGLHGHSLDSVSVSGTTLQAGSPNTIPASPPPKFDVTFTNTGGNTEKNVVVKVTVSGTSVSAQTTVAQTTAGEQKTVTIPLPSSPPKGRYTITVTVQGVPGEKNLANNTLSFPVQFT
jgi:archaellum component FlaF (FlaF/FlaG flagellin family)